MSLAILFHFLCAQHVSDINISIIRSLRLFCWVTTLVILFLVRFVLEFRCGWFGVVSLLQAEAPCINDNQTLCYPTNAQYTISRYNWNYKIFKSAPTCFGSQRIHHQGALYSGLAKNYKNDYIVSVDMDKVGVMASYSDPLCLCVVHCICCHNTDLVHVNGHDRIILVIFSQALYNAPSVIRNMLEQF